MSQASRMYCSKCKNSIFNTLIDGIRIPLVLYFVVGQPGDTGAPLAINDPGVKLPSFVRALMLPHVPVARAELCMTCVADVFGVPLVTADEDPMFSIEQAEITKAEVGAVVDNVAIDEVNTNAKVMERPFLAFKVGRGESVAPALPPSRQPAAPPISPPIPPIRVPR